MQRFTDQVTYKKYLSASLQSLRHYSLASIAVESFAIIGAMFASVFTAGSSLIYFIELSLFLQFGLAIKWLGVLALCRWRGRLSLIIGLPALAAGLWMVLLVVQIRSHIPGITQIYPVYLPVVLDLVAGLWVALGIKFYINKQHWRRTAELVRDDLSHRTLRHHFLFNTLNTTACLIHVQPGLAEDNLVKLAELYRALLQQQSTVTLQEEIMMTCHYLDLEQTRLGDRLVVEWDFPDQLPTTAPMPAMLLQPLVENAVYHGIEPSATGGAIQITITCDEGYLYFRLCNPSCDASKMTTSGNRLAQQMIRQRLNHLYGTDSNLLVQQTPNQYIIHFKIPLGGNNHEYFNC